MTSESSDIRSERTLFRAHLGPTLLHKSSNQPTNERDLLPNRPSAGQTSPARRVATSRILHPGMLSAANTYALLTHFAGFPTSAADPKIHTSWTLILQMSRNRS
jgi:hypothetical protein